MKVGLKIFCAGYCTHPEFIVIKGGRRKSVNIPALFALIEHPTQGHILFDTGYHPRFYDASSKFPYSIYAAITPVYCKENESAAQQLEASGIDPDSIQTIIVSHFHADHIAGLKDFPNAKFIYLKEAYEAVRGKTGFAAVKLGYLPDLLPNDFEQRSQVIDEESVIQLGEDDQPFSQGFDVFGDESLIAVELPGHAHGQIGIFLTDQNNQSVFLAADACWYSEAYRTLRFPHPLANLALADKKAYRVTLKKLHQLHQRRPEVWIVPSHCPEIMERA